MTGVNNINILVMGNKEGNKSVAVAFLNNKTACFLLNIKVFYGNKCLIATDKGKVFKVRGIV